MLGTRAPNGLRDSWKAIFGAALAVCVAALTSAGAQAADAGEAVDAAAPVAPTVDRQVLVPAGETIDDIDTITEGLDRQSPVSAIAFSPDGTLIASGSEDHRVRLWQPATGRLVRRLDGHSSAVTAVAFSPDGSAVASASNDRTVRLWDVRSGQLLRTLQGHVYHVYAVAFDPRGRWLATASWDRTIQFWDAKSGELVRKLRGHGAAIRAIDFSPDGTLLASGSDDETVRLWNAETGREVKVLAGHAGPVNAVRFRPDGESVFSGSTDHTVRMWRLSDGARWRKLADCGGPVRALAVSANGQILGGTCGVAGSVLWDVGTGSEIRRGHGPKGETRAIAFRPDGKVVATGGEDASIAVEDVATGRALVSLSANLAHLEAVAFGPGGSMLATASRDGHVRVWQNAGDRKILSPLLSRVSAGGQGPLRTLAFSSDGKTIATGGDERTVTLWDLGDGTEHRVGRHDGAINAVAFVPGGHTLASAGEDGTVRLWDLKKDAAAKILKGHRAPVQALAVSADGTMVASASDDETVRVWETATGRSLAVLSSNRGPVTSVLFSADGKYLITGSQDRSIDVWLLAKRKLLKSLRKELAAGVVALVESGQRIVAASSDGALSLWEIGGNRPLKQVIGPTDAPSALAIAPDGSTVASASRDGVLRIWDAANLGRRWTLVGSSQERWFACNEARICWRNEDGILLGRITAQGERVPVSPSDEAHRTLQGGGVDPSGTIEILEGRTVAIPIRIENRGRHPSYWVKVAQSAMPATARGSLLLIAPPTTAVLAPGDSATIVCEVSALADYENPQPHGETLRLSITSASAEPLSVEIPIWVDTPHLRLRRLALLRGRSQAVVASMSDVSMAELEPVRLQGDLTLEGGKQTSIAPVALEQPFIGQDLALAFPLPEGVGLGRQSRMTFTIRKSTHPAHVWTFANVPVRIPLPLWAWVLLASGVLGLGFGIWRARLYVRARPLGRAGKRSARLAVAVLLGLGKGFLALVLFPSTLRRWRARLERRGVAITFFRLQPETQCSHLARQLGASWVPLANGHQPIFDLQLGPEVPLNVERCLLALPTPETAASVLAHLDSVDEGACGITVVLSELPRSELLVHLRASRRLVVLNRAAMERVLRAPRPALAFAQVVSRQVDRMSLSLYRSAVSNGQRQPFCGRKSELRRMTADSRKNYLVIGPYGIGKTRLLDEIYRRFRTHPTVECHYLSLADGDLTAALGDALGMPGEVLLDVLLERLADRPKGKQVVVLCDDADTWATLDAARGGAQLQTLTLLNQEHPCSFVLAGFLGLLYAARPVRGRQRFGDVVRIESLDAEACTELATSPMAALNVHYAKSDLVERLTQQSAGMPGLLLALCDQVLERLPPDQHIIERAEVEYACKSEAVAHTITAWRPRFGLPEPRFATLDQTVLLSAVFKPHFTLEELQSTLAGLGVQATATEVQHSADRLVAACVFEHWLGYFHFRVPLFQTVMQEATLARMIEQLRPEE
jgi:WD40 repeat protein